MTFEFTIVEKHQNVTIHPKYVELWAYERPNSDTFTYALETWYNGALRTRWISEDDMKSFMSDDDLELYYVGKDSHTPAANKRRDFLKKLREEGNAQEKQKWRTNYTGKGGPRGVRKPPLLGKE